jgi:putative tryptophan/tyrosine transport system substrate-binding protein
MPPSRLRSAALYNRGVVWCLVLIMCLVGSLSAPLVVESQSVGTKRVRIGYLALHRPPSASDPVWQAFAQRLRELGWANGSNAVIERRYADGPGERLDALAAELVAGSVDVLVASGTSAVLAAKRATTTVPIVIAGASDPVGFGIVASLAQPGGNVTGVSDSPGREIEGKRLELLKETVPEATRVGVVLDSSGRRDPGSIADAAKALGLTLLVSLETTNTNEFRRSVAALKRDGAQALYAPETPVNAHHRDLIVSLAVEHRLPAMYGSREFVEGGGLLAYGTSYVRVHQRAADYVDRILRGSRPADLPVEQPTHLELSVNLRTAAVLGLKIPTGVLLRADHVVR